MDDKSKDLNAQKPKTVSNGGSGLVKKDIPKPPVEIVLNQKSLQEEIEEIALRRPIISVDIEKIDSSSNSKSSNMPSQKSEPAIKNGDTVVSPEVVAKVVTDAVVSEAALAINATELGTKPVCDSNRVKNQVEEDLKKLVDSKSDKNGLSKQVGKGSPQEKISSSANNESGPKIYTKEAKEENKNIKDIPETKVPTTKPNSGQTTCAREAVKTCDVGVGVERRHVRVATGDEEAEEIDGEQATTEVELSESDSAEGEQGAQSDNSSRNSSRLSSAVSIKTVEPSKPESATSKRSIPDPSIYKPPERRKSSNISRKSENDKEINGKTTPSLKENGEDKTVIGEKEDNVEEEKRQAELGSLDANEETESRGKNSEGASSRSEGDTKDDTEENKSSGDNDKQDVSQKLQEKEVEEEEKGGEKSNEVSSEDKDVMEDEKASVGVKEEPEAKQEITSKETDSSAEDSEQKISEESLPEEKPPEEVEKGSGEESKKAEHSKEEEKEESGNPPAEDNEKEANEIGREIANGHPQKEKDGEVGEDGEKGREEEEQEHPEEKDGEEASSVSAAEDPNNERPASGAVDKVVEDSSNISVEDADPGKESATRNVDVPETAEPDGEAEEEKETEKPGDESKSTEVEQSEEHTEENVASALEDNQDASQEETTQEPGIDNPNEDAEKKTDVSEETKKNTDSEEQENETENNGEIRSESRTISKLENVEENDETEEEQAQNVEGEKESDIKEGNKEDKEAEDDKEDKEEDENKEENKPEEIKNEVDEGAADKEETDKTESTETDAIVDAGDSSDTKADDSTVAAEDNPEKESEQTDDKGKETVTAPDETPEKLEDTKVSEDVEGKEDEQANEIQNQETSVNEPEKDEESQQKLENEEDKPEKEENGENKVEESEKEKRNAEEKEEEDEEKKEDGEEKKEDEEEEKEKKKEEYEEKKEEDEEKKVEQVNEAESKQTIDSQEEKGDSNESPKKKTELQFQETEGESPPKSPVKRGRSPEKFGRRGISPISSPPKSLRTPPSPKKPQKSTSPRKKNGLLSPIKTPKTPGGDARKLPPIKAPVGLAPNPNLKNIKSKIGSFDNIKYKPGGGDKKVISIKLDWKAAPKIGSLDRRNKEKVLTTEDAKVADFEIGGGVEDEIAMTAPPVLQPGTTPGAIAAES